jgi:hypothetical protein
MVNGSKDHFGAGMSTIASHQVMLGFVIDSDYQVGVELFNGSGPDFGRILAQIFYGKMVNPKVMPSHEHGQAVAIQRYVNTFIEPLNG